jgi:hypothetical protein
MAASNTKKVAILARDLHLWHWLVRAAGDDLPLLVLADRELGLLRGCGPPRQEENRAVATVGVVPGWRLPLKFTLADVAPRLLSTTRTGIPSSFKDA